jgi:hypothetical protein
MINNLIKKGLHLFTSSFFVLNPVQAEMFSIPFGKNILRSSDLEIEVSLKSKLLLEKSEIILNCFNDEGFKIVFGINLNPVSVNHIYSHDPKSNNHWDVNTPLKVVTSEKNKIITFDSTVDEGIGVVDIFNLKEMIIDSVDVDYADSSTYYMKWNCESFTYK